MTDQTEPLRAAAQRVVDLAEPDDNWDGEYIDYLVPDEAISALRAALATPPATGLDGWVWECVSCDRPVPPMGMCETCGVFGVMRLSRAPEHQWTTDDQHDYEWCRVCLFVRQRNGSSDAKPCKGPARVATRGEVRAALATQPASGLDVERLARATHASYLRDPQMPRITWDDINDADRAMWRGHAEAIAAAYTEDDR